eukprot:Skav218273  [mRNA]  locus=scaffold2035:302486:308327:- [translate_table: standard]
MALIRLQCPVLPVIDAHSLRKYLLPWVTHGRLAQAGDGIVGTRSLAAEPVSVPMSLYPGLEIPKSQVTREAASTEKQTDEIDARQGVSLCVLSGYSSLDSQSLVTAAGECTSPNALCILRWFAAACLVWHVTLWELSTRRYIYSVDHSRADEFGFVKMPSGTEWKKMKEIAWRRMEEIALEMLGVSATAHPFVECGDDGGWQRWSTNCKVYEKDAELVNEATPPTEAEDVPEEKRETELQDATTSPEATPPTEAEDVPEEKRETELQDATTSPEATRPKEPEEEPEEKENHKQSSNRQTDRQPRT